MAIETPPTLSPGLQKELDDMISVFNANSSAIIQQITTRGLEAAGLSDKKVSLTPIVNLIDRYIVPTVHYWETGWAEHPTDKDGAVMRGVMIPTLTSLYNTIFIDTNVGQVQAAANLWNRNHPKWRDDKQLRKQLLYTLCSDPGIAKLFIYQFICSDNARFPIGIMTEDPFLGFLQFECVWGSGNNVFSSNEANFDGLLKEYGWNGDQSTWATTIQKAGDKTPEIASRMLLYRFNHIKKLSKDGTTNNAFQESWLKRLLTDNKSDLMMMVVINELFNQNIGGNFTLTQQELDHLKRKAEIYKTLSINIPD